MELSGSAIVILSFALAVSKMRYNWEEKNRFFGKTDMECTRRYIDLQGNKKYYSEDFHPNTISQKEQISVSLLTLSSANVQIHKRKEMIVTYDIKIYQKYCRWWCHYVK